MTVSLKCGDFIHKNFEVTRQIALELGTIPWPTPRFQNAPPDVQREILQFLAKEALLLTNQGLTELAAADVELARMAESDGTACGPCRNGSVCPRMTTPVGNSTFDIDEIDVIMVQPVARPGFTGIHILFNYTPRQTFKLHCDDAGCMV